MERERAENLLGLLKKMKELINVTNLIKTGRQSDSVDEVALVDEIEKLYR